MESCRKFQMQLKNFPYLVLLAHTAHCGFRDDALYEFKIDTDIDIMET